jgi:acyl carrier protein
MDNNLIELTKIFRNILKNNSLEIKSTDTPNDIDGWDSLSHSQLLAEIEDFFSIEFKLKELAGIRSIGDILDLIKAKTNADL